jgi:hypothetical protein
MSLPKYTLMEAQEAKDSLVSVIEFAFFTALSDQTDRGIVPDVGPVVGGGMVSHQGRHELIVALVDRLLYDEDLVLYPAPKPAGSGDAS